MHDMHTRKLLLVVQAVAAFHARRLVMNRVSQRRYCCCCLSCHPIRNVFQLSVKVKKVRNASQIPRNRLAKKGEGDRHIGTLRPKHLFAGKRPGFGTASHR